MNGKITMPPKQNPQNNNPELQPQQPQQPIAQASQNSPQPQQPASNQPVAQTKSKLPLLVGAGVIALIIIGVLAWTLLGKSLTPEERDAIRQEDIASFATGLDSYIESNGQLPSLLGQNTVKPSSVSDGNFKDPTTGDSYRIVEIEPTVGSIGYSPSSSCSADGEVFLLVASSSDPGKYDNNYSVLMPLELGGSVCLDN